MIPLALAHVLVNVADHLRVKQVLDGFSGSHPMRVLLLGV
jgi:hypothetical protein